MCIHVLAASWSLFSQSLANCWPFKRGHQGAWFSSSFWPKSPEVWENEQKLNSNKVKETFYQKKKNKVKETQENLDQVALKGFGYEDSYS